MQEINLSQITMQHAGGISYMILIKTYLTFLQLYYEDLHAIKLNSKH